MNNSLKKRTNLKKISLRELSSASLTNGFFLGLQTLLFIVLTPMILKALGAETYGIWTMLMAITGLAGLAEFGIGGALVKYVAQYSQTTANESHELSTIISFSFIFLLCAGILVGGVMYALRYYISNKISSQTILPSEIEKTIIIAAIGMIPIFISQLCKGILLGLIYNKIICGVEFIKNAAIQISILLIGIHCNSIVNIITVNVGINIIILILLIIIVINVTKCYHIKINIKRPLIREFLNYSFFSWITNWGAILFSQADRLVVGLVLGPIAAGAYSICTGVAGRLNNLASSLTSVLVPFVSSYKVNGIGEDIRKAFYHSSRLVACLLAIIGIILIIWSKEILDIWISSQFANSYSDIFRILVICYVLFSMAAPGYNICLGLGRPELPAIVSFASAFLMILLVFILAPPFGLTGAAIANLVYSLAYVVNGYVAHVLGLKRVSFITKSIGPPIFVLLTVYLIISIGNYKLISLIITALISFIALLWMAINELSGNVLYTKR